MYMTNLKYYENIVNVRENDRTLFNKVSEQYV